MVVALAVRLLYFLLYQRSPLFDLYVADQIYYRYWAMAIAKGDWLGKEIFEQGPLYAYLLGGLFKFFGPLLKPILIIQLLFGTCTVALIWWCTRRIAGSGAAVAAGLLAAIYGPFVFYESMLMKSFLEPLLVMTTLAAFLKGHTTNRAHWHALAGLALGLACLVREVHIILLVPFIFASLLHRDTNNKNFRQRFLPVMALVACFALTLLPTTLRNWAVGKEFVPVTTGGGEVVYMSFGPTANGYYAPPYFVTPHPFAEHQDFRKEAYFRTLTPMSRKESSAFWYREAFKEIIASPRRSIGLILKKTAILFNNDEVPDSENYDFTVGLIPAVGFLPTFGWLTGLGFLGAILLWRRGMPGKLAIFLAVMLILEVLLTYNYGRFRLALCAVWMIFAGTGVAQLCQAEFWRGSKNYQRIAFAGGVILLAAALSWMPPPRASMASNIQQLETLALEAAEKRSFIPRLRHEAAIMPDDPDPHYYLGVSLWATGMIGEAIEAYEEVLRIRPDDPDTHRNLANIFRHYDRLDRALKHAEMLITLMPEDFYGYYLTGILKLESGMASTDAKIAARHFKDAVIDLQRAATLQPQGAEIHHELGKALYFIGNIAAARRELATALDINPEYLQAAYDSKYLNQRHAL